MNNNTRAIVAMVEKAGTTPGTESQAVAEILRPPSLSKFGCESWPITSWERNIVQFKLGKREQYR